MLTLEADGVLGLEMTAVDSVVGLAGTLVTFVAGPADVRGRTSLCVGVVADVIDEERFGVDAVPEAVVAGVFGVAVFVGVLVAAGFVVADLGDDPYRRL